MSHPHPSLRARAVVTVLCAAAAAVAGSTTFSLEGGSLLLGAGPGRVAWLAGPGLAPIQAGFGAVTLYALATATVLKPVDPRRVRRLALAVGVVFLLFGALLATGVEVSRARVDHRVLEAGVLVKVVASSILGPLGLFALAETITLFGLGNGVVLVLLVDLAARSLAQGGIAAARGPAGMALVLGAPAIGLLLARRARVLAESDASLSLPLVVAGVIPIGMAGGFVVLPVALLANLGVQPTAAPVWLEPVARAGLTVFFAFFLTALCWPPRRLLGLAPVTRGAAVDEAERARSAPVESHLNRAALANGLALAALAYAPGWPMPALAAAAALDIAADIGAFSRDTVSLGEIATVGDLERARAVLTAAGIPQTVRSAAARLLVLDFGMYARLEILVPAAEAARARALLP